MDEKERSLNEKLANEKLRNEQLNNEQFNYQTSDRQVEPMQTAPDEHTTGRHYYSIGQKVTSESNHSTTPPVNMRVESTEIEQQLKSELRHDASINQPYGAHYDSQQEQASAKQTFKVTEKKQSRIKVFSQYFAMFIASVLVVGAFMFLSDNNNWFTADSDNASTEQSQQATKPSNEQGSVASYLEDRPDNISELFKTASPAVVKIETYSEVTYRNRSSILDDPFFRQFFGENAIPKQNEGEGTGELQQTGMGTGFFFDESGYILTNQHVVGDSIDIRVIVEGYDEPFQAELLGSSFDLDLAVIKLNEDIKFPILELGSSENISIGDWVVAIGNPYGFDHTLTVGVISAKERPINIYDEEGERNYKNLLQTDASINPGNSGGPLLNLNGQVIGINTAVSAQAQGIGFAIPTSTITEVLDMLKNNEEIPAEPVPFLGVRMSQLTDNMLEGTGLTKAEGVRVENIVYGSPAYTGGLNQYDIITQIDDKMIKNPQELSEYVSSKKVGDTIQIHVVRRGESIVVPIEIGDQNHYQVE